jgi:hypothetical protein
MRAGAKELRTTIGFGTFVRPEEVDGTRPPSGSGHKAGASIWASQNHTFPRAGSYAIASEAEALFIDDWE